MNGYGYPCFNQPKSPLPGPKFLLAVLAMLLLTILVFWNIAKAETPPATEGYATYYTVKSCLLESGQYRMANGRLLNDEKLTCASWGYRFGTMLRVTNLHNGRSVIVEVTDRGPAKRLVKKGKIIDLSKRGFIQLSSLTSGVIPVKVERIN